MLRYLTTMIRSERERTRRVYCATESGAVSLIAVLGLNLTSLGIPCIYYGSEQGFDGRGESDRFIRESMFGGDFGAFRSKSRHFFQEGNPWFPEIGKIIEVRNKQIALRRGRQYLRPISGDGVNFGLPVLMGNKMNSIVAWSRIFNDQEILCAFNTDIEHETIAYVTIDSELHVNDSKIKCLYASAPCPPEINIENRNGKSVRLTLPPGGFVIYM